MYLIPAISIVAVLLAWCVSPQATAAQPGGTAAWLTPEEGQFLDGLMKQFLFDPKGAQYVRVKITRRTEWASTQQVSREGWLVAGAEGRPARVYFTDGENIPLPAKQADWEKVDLVELCRAQYRGPEKRSATGGSRGETARVARPAADGQESTPHLALAAWLYRFGQAELAAKALERATETAAEARSTEEYGSQRPKQNADESNEVMVVRVLKDGLASSAFSAMLRAYLVRADEEALVHGERLLRLYPEQAKEHSPQAEAMVAELKRRQQKDTFGKKPPEGLPQGFSGWDVQKKIAWLVDALEEAEGRDWSSSALAADRRVAAVVEIGDPAVPTLIDAIENDQRLTRAVRYDNYGRRPAVLGVRDAALSAVTSILRVRTFAFNRGAADGSLALRGDKAAAQIAAQLREYWSTYGRLPLDERMMNVLTDPKADFEATREAAGNLGSLVGRIVATTVLSAERAPASAPLHPIVTKFSRPTAAEAILAAMDRDLAHHDADKPDRRRDLQRRQIEDSYLGPLASLGDKRIAAELARRFRAAEDCCMRRKYAYACHVLGDLEPLKTFAGEVEKGSVKLPASDVLGTSDNDQPGAVELSGIVDCLVKAATPEADRALHAVAAPHHAYYPMVADRVLHSRLDYGRDAWLAHPFCLAVLRRGLDDARPNGFTWQIESDNVKRFSPSYSNSSSIPEILRDPAMRRSTARERACDAAAEKLSALVFGLPPYHPLLKDADARLRATRALCDRCQEHFRLLTPAEADLLGISSWGIKFVPAIEPLGRAATPQDVEQGLAVFHLDGKGKTATMKLPAVASLRRDDRSRRLERVLVVQAEVGPDDKTTYGVIARDAIRAAEAPELSDIKPIAK